MHQILEASLVASKSYLTSELQKRAIMEDDVQKYVPLERRMDAVCSASPALCKTSWLHSEMCTL